MSDKHIRSILKTISWRVIATSTTMLVVYLFTGEAMLSLGIGGLEATAKMFLYYFHERSWNKLRWGTY